MTEPVKATPVNPPAPTAVPAAIPHVATGTSVPTPAATKSDAEKKASKVADAKKKVEAKQDTFNKANDATLKAHAELVSAQKELATLDT